MPRRVGSNALLVGAARWILYDANAMRIRTSDRYLVREMVGPFLLSVFGLVLFIMLSLIINLSELLVDRGVSPLTLARLLVLKLPSLVVLALPVSGLFAMFLGLGRLTHDREIIALEAAGISLRRALAPLLVVALAVAVVDFALYNWGVPSSESAFQRAYLGVIYRQGAPRLQSDTFFKGPEGEVLYARRYNREDGSLSEVLVYDHVGKLFRLQDAAVTIISAERGTWQGDAWELENGRVYGVDREGHLVHTATFEALTIPVQATAAQFFVESRQPTEMGIAELQERIRTLTSRGLSADGLVLECHRKIAIPMATLVFVLLGGAMSLIFAWRSRAAGIVLSFLLIGAYQGVFLWMGTLGERGILPPALAAWLPNLSFALVGAALFVRLDRLSSRDLLQRLRRAIPFLGTLLATLVVGVTAASETPPVTVNSDTLEISADGDHLHATGHVRLDYEDVTVAAADVQLDRLEGDVWTLTASGEVTAQLGEDFTFVGDVIEARLDGSDGLLRTQNVVSEGFRGRSQFVNSDGERHVLQFEGDLGHVRFDDDGEATEIEIEDARLSTCDCCGGAFSDQPYSIEARRMRLLPDRLIVAYDLKIRVYGAGVFWLPVYVQPLEDTLESPLFPAIGRSGLHGWFLKWNVPFFVNERTYGAVLFDIYSRFLEVGGGVLLHYGLGRHEGVGRIYTFPATVGDSVFDAELAHDIALGEDWTVGGEASFSRRGETRELAYAIDADGRSGAWTVTSTARRERTETDDHVRFTERAPELSLTGDAWARDGLTVTPLLTGGWYREWDAGEQRPSGLFRGVGSVRLALDTLGIGRVRLSPTAAFEISRYLADDTWDGRTAATAGLVAYWPFGRLEYDLVRVSSSSPLLLDALDPLHRITWMVFAEGDRRVELSGVVDLDAGAVEPVRIEVVSPGPHRWTLRGAYDVVHGSPVDVQLGYVWTSTEGVIRMDLPIDLELGVLEPLAWSVRRDGDRGSSTLEGKLDLVTGASQQLSGAVRLEDGERFALDARAELTMDAWEIGGSLEWSFAAGWGGLVGATLRSGAAAVLAPRAGLFRDLEECLRIGLELESGQVWLYASVLAFPGAILRYSPNTAGVVVGR